MIKSTTGLTDTDDVHYRNKVHTKYICKPLQTYGPISEIFYGNGASLYVFYCQSLGEYCKNLICYIRTIIFF